MVLLPPPVQVTWIHSVEDQPIARELVRLAGVLERQGLIRNLVTYGLATPKTLMTGHRAAHNKVAVAAYAQPLERGAVEKHVAGGDIAVFLVSPAALADKEWQFALGNALREAGPRIVLVLVRAVAMDELPEQARRMVVPKDGTAIATHRDRDDALLEVIEALQEIASFYQPDASPPPPSPMPKGEVLSINEIFRLNGPRRSPSSNRLSSGCCRS